MPSPSVSTVAVSSVAQVTVVGYSVSVARITAFADLAPPLSSSRRDRHRFVDRGPWRRVL